MSAKNFKKYNIVQGPTAVQYVTGENKAPFEIMPIPGRVNDTSASLVDGKFVCNICNNKFSEEQQFTLHKNIHYFERPFRCEGTERHPQRNVNYANLSYTTETSLM